MARFKNSNSNSVNTKKKYWDVIASPRPKPNLPPLGSKSDHVLLPFAAARALGGQFESFGGHRGGQFRGGRFRQPRRRKSAAVFLADFAAGSTRRSFASAGKHFAAASQRHVLPVPEAGQIGR